MKYFFFIFLVPLASCQLNHDLIKNEVAIKVYTYQDSNAIKATAMPELKADSKLQSFARRFDYLLINVSEIHQPNKFETRNSIWSLYPDTIQLKRKYLNEFSSDKKLKHYFAKTYKAILQDETKKKVEYSTQELMDVASKFFYCDSVLPDTTVQAHVCIGLNGVKEAKWAKDYTLLEAFCYEAIFSDLDKDSSQVWESFGAIKSKSEWLFRKKISSLPSYLESVKKEVLKQMNNDPILKTTLVAYYQKNQSNLSFRIVN
jgi:hypothetical protein